MKTKLLVFLVLCMVLFYFAAPGQACSDLQVKAKDNTIVIGRTMELSIDTNSKIWVVPRGIKHTSTDDNGNKGISWTSKYGFLGIDSFGEKGMFLDGLNEKGLTFGALFFTGSIYQEPVPGKFVALGDLGSWILGNFESVDQIKEELPKINVVGQYSKDLHGIPAIHIAVHDAKGKNIVIEFINGQTKIYDNPLGVMTNRPNFEWQMNNLRNYVNLVATDKDPRTINGVKIEPTGVGSGLLGLPGDWTPPSRFVKLAFCVDSALPAKNAGEAVNLTEHILNTVDIPKGVIKEKINPFLELYGTTQWLVIKDLTNKIIYFRCYNDMTLKKVDLTKLDLKPGTPEKAIAMESKINTIIDKTQELL